MRPGEALRLADHVLRWRHWHAAADDADERAATLGTLQGVLRAAAPAEAARIDTALRQAWIGDARDLLAIASTEAAEIAPKPA